MNGLALFAGGGGLELGLSLALGTNYRTITYVERECTSAAVLAANMERGWLDKAPIWDDVTTFTGDVVSPLVDNIDIISAGFPCQPWSVAGNRKGTEDERWLWPHIFGLVREIRPRSIFLENVPGLLHGGIQYVLGDLASLGFFAEWTSVRASDVGAPHRRERIFIFASLGNTHKQGQSQINIRQGLSEGSAPVANSNNLSGQVSPSGRADGTSGAVAAGASRELGNTNGSGLSTRRHREREHKVRDNKDRSASEDQQQRGVWESGASEGSEALGDTDGKGLEGWQQPVRQSSDERPAWPPSPANTDAWEKVSEQYFPATKPEVRGVANGLARGLARADQLRILGNGVVPQQAALAYTLLSGRISNS
jgi:DNA (cytosine-5)-methyltransferase 1